MQQDVKEKKLSLEIYMIVIICYNNNQKKKKAFKENSVFSRYGYRLTCAVPIPSTCIEKSQKYTPCHSPFHMYHVLGEGGREGGGKLQTRG